MINETNFQNFKPYNHYTALRMKSDTHQPKKDVKKYILPLIGSSLGVAAGYFGTKNKKLNNHIANDLFHLLAMAGGANIGSVILGSIGKTPKQIEKKVKEGAFQIMNSSIPLLLVGFANEICDRTIKHSKPIVRVLSSLAAMATGAFAATKITNKIRKDGEPERKYTIKDSVANIDDLVATLSIGFGENVENLHLETRLMPFIYAYCGMRAGAKE